MLTKEGISTTPLAIWADRRTMEPGTARKAALRQSSAVQPCHLEGTLSHQFAPPLEPEISYMSVRRKDSSTAFLAHWLTCQLPSAWRSATRRVPLSSAVSVASIASRASPLVAGVMVSRASHAVSMAASSAA